MKFVKTPHLNQCAKIAKTVLMPGDPLRAKYIAETFLEDVILFNEIRGMLGFTGKYKGKEISIMASGMGMPSIGIYSYELFKFFKVENIIRIGSAGAWIKDLNLYDIILAEDTYSQSTYARICCNNNNQIISANKELNEKAKKYAKQLNIPLKVGRFYSSDVFYYEQDPDIEMIVDKQGCICSEMESFALFANAKMLNKKAICLVTISGSRFNQKVLSAQEREMAFNDMIKIALEFAE